MCFMDLAEKLFRMYGVIFLRGNFPFFLTQNTVLPQYMDCLMELIPELSRAHTLCMNLQRAAAHVDDRYYIIVVLGQLCTLAESTWPRCGLQNDTPTPCQLIRSMLKPVFHQFQQIDCMSLRCLEADVCADNDR